MRILVTGGAGFIGSHIVDALIEHGHHVGVLDNLSTGRRENVHTNAAFFQGDIRDPEAVRAVVGSGRFDAICHQAAQIDVRRSVADPAYDASVNLVGFLTLMEAAVLSGVRRVVFASSGGAIYGEQDTFPADESHPTRPISPYGVAKLATEQYLHYYSEVHGVRSVSLRYANVYGPRQNPEGEAGVVAIFATRMLQGQQPVINGDGKQTRDYVFVGDVVQANMLALDRAGSGIYNIGTGVETDVNTLFHGIRAITGSACEERHAEPKKGEQLRSVLSAARMSRDFGWKPGTDLEHGLRATVDFFRQSYGKDRAAAR